MRRSLLGMSQEKLADSTGVTFQQIQKYERGANRVSAGRLYEFSQALEVPVGYFFEEYSETGVKRQRQGLTNNNQDSGVADDLLYSKETYDLLRIYYSIKAASKRKELVKMILLMAKALIASS